MGCQIGVCKHAPEEQTSHLLSLPNEVLIKIISFLQETRDRVTLRFVCRRLQNLCLTPSLWREFTWADCSCREENRLYDVMEASGTHIKRLSFPQYFIRPGPLQTIGGTTQKLLKVSGMVKALQHCRNITYLNLPALDYVKRFDDVDMQLRKTIEGMEHLEVLNIHCATSFQPYLNLKIKLKELTIRTVIRSMEDIEGTQDWVANGFTPLNLNIVVLDGSIYPAMTSCKEFLLSVWLEWNSKVPTGYVACLKLYTSYKTPLCLFQNAPLFQLHYGETITLPFVLMRLHDIWLLLTDHDDGNKAVYKAKVFYRPSDQLYMYNILYNHRKDIQLQEQLDIFTNLTELDFSDDSSKFREIVPYCPQLQRLDFGHNARLRIDDLRMIATCCYNLQGMKLLGMRIPDIGLCMKAWKILSNMKLTYLSTDIAFLGSSLVMEDRQEKQLAALFARCTKLKALQLEGRYFLDIYEIEINSNVYKLLAYFPSLEYCRLSNYRSKQSSSVQEVLTSCKSLRYFYCNCSVKLSISSARNKNLQQLCISSKNTDLNDNFMDTISAHGGLIHVALFVNSVTTNGITTLIRNSPNLLTFGLYEQKQYKESYLESLNTSLHKKFAKRKLFTIGLFGIIQKMEDRYAIRHDEQYIEYDDWLQHTDLLALWTPHTLVDLNFTCRYGGLLTDADAS